jgi:hypothetical protein
LTPRMSMSLSWPPPPPQGPILKTDPCIDFPGRPEAASASSREMAGGERYGFAFSVCTSMKTC